MSEKVKPNSNERGGLLGFNLEPVNFPIWAKAKRVEVRAFGDSNHGSVSVEVDYTSEVKQRPGSRMKHRIEEF